MRRCLDSNLELLDEDPSVTPRWKHNLETLLSKIALSISSHFTFNLRVLLSLSSNEIIFFLLFLLTKPDPFFAASRDLVVLVERDLLVFESMTKIFFVFFCFQR